jgi:ribosomal protein S18 acetylase RimI-like enzyme
VAEVDIRPFRSEDLEAGYAILHEEQRELGEPEITLGMFSNLQEIAEASFTAERAGEVVGSSRTRAGAIELGVRRSDRRQGIGTRLLAVAEESTEAPVLRIYTTTLQPAGAAFARACAYEKAWDYWLMGIDLDNSLEPPQWPDDVAVRTFREDDAEAVKELLDLAYAEEADHVPMALEDWKTFMLGDPNFDPSFWFLVEAEGELAAAALNWDDGYVKDLVVHPERRRRRIGESLMRHTFREFRRRGVERVTLKTDSVNPTEAWRLYERLGMRKERTYEVFEKRR